MEQPTNKEVLDTVKSIRDDVLSIVLSCFISLVIYLETNDLPLTVFSFGGLSVIFILAFFIRRKL